MNPHRFILCFVIVVFIPQISSAQFMPGAEQIALAHSDIAANTDVFALFNNPAGLAKVKFTQAGVFYSPSPFGLKELANGFAGICKNFGIGTFAAGFSTYGFELYKENKFTLSFASEIQKIFFAGVSIFYNSLSIKNYGSDNNISVTIGSTINLSSELFFGFTAENITRSTYGNEANQIPVIYRTGLSYNLDRDFIIHLAFEKEIENPLSLRFGIDYKPINYLNLRFGFMNEPSLFSGGIGVNYSGFSIDYALFTHQDLGLTHQAGLIINL